MTVNELLGIEENERERETVIDRFPTYDEFRNSRVSYSQNRGGLDTLERADRRELGGYSEPNYGRDSYSENGFGGYSQSRRDWFDYASSDFSRADEQNLLGRLEYTNESFRPVYDRNVENANKTAAKEKEGRRARLTTKGKLIVCSLAALIVTTVGLIIGYAGKINSGTALMPASNSNATEIISTQTI